LLGKSQSYSPLDHEWLTEIREAIEHLAPEERAELREWLNAQDMEESPEFLAAVDQGDLVCGKRA